MGGWAPFGYEVKDRKLIVNAKDARVVRSIFQRFATLRSATLLAKELREKNVRNRYGHAIDKGVLYKLLNNRTCVGEAVHKAPPIQANMRRSSIASFGTVSMPFWARVRASEPRPVARKPLPS
jgi:hypothetical protein